MKAIIHGLAEFHRGVVMTENGDCHLESRCKEAVEIVTRALNEHDDLIKERYALIIQREKLIAQRDALVKVCGMLLAWNSPTEAMRANEFSRFVPVTLPEVIGAARAALAMVRETNG